MKDWFLERIEKRVTVDTMLPGDKGGSYTGVVVAVYGDAVVLQLPNIRRLIAFTAIESATEMQAF